MKRTYYQISKYIFLFGIGGTLYYIIEMLSRGHSHWSMWILGGICFIGLGLINKVLSRDTPLWKQALIGGFLVITPLEFLTGCVVNLLLQWNVWNYTRLDLLGQVCLPFTLLWCFLSIFAIILDDYLRYWLYGEEKPRYKFV